MNAPTVLVSVLLSSGAAAGIVFFAAPAGESLPDPALAEARLEVAALQEKVTSLEARLAEVASAPAAANPAASNDRVRVPTLSEEQVAVAVEAYLQNRGRDAAVPAAADGEPMSVGEMFASLDGTNFWENSEAWKKAHAEGRMDELLDMFEEAAEAFPNDIDKQMALANAYMAYLQMDQTKWQMSMKADEVYDRVLALDERHWEARFTKAVSYTFWPDFLGKKNDAISHFETLVEQQESSPVEDHQAQTYLYLGNLLESKDPEKAREMWARGAARHPNNADLRAKIGN